MTLCRGLRACLFFLLMSAVSSFIGGCAAPALATWAERYQWHHFEINSHPYALQAMMTTPSADASLTASRRSLHVYLEGDGNAFLTPTIVSSDPTPHDPLTLELMAQDPAPSIFIARPCYFGQPSYCTPLLWTLARYSAPVVESIADAVTTIAKPYDEVVLIGFSGGGTLAVLVAPKVKKVTRVITLAGNLDTEKWTEHHALSPLSASLNPAKEPPLPVRVKQTHYIGSDDKNILPAWVTQYSALQLRSEVVNEPHFNHRCCWVTHWSRLLQDALSR